MNDSNGSSCELLVDWMDADWKMITMLSDDRASKWKAQYAFTGIFSGCIFLLAVATLFQTKSTIVCRMHSCKKQVRNVVFYFYSLEVLIAVMGLSRFLVNVVNYAADGIFNSNVVYLEAVLSALSLPCLTVGFTLLFLCILQSALKLKQLSWMARSCINPKGILAMSLLHFVTNITGQLLTKLDVGKGLVIRLCHLFFVFWGAFLFLAFPIVGCYVRKGARGLRRLSTSERRGKTEEIRYERLFLLTSVSSVAGLALCVMYCFAVIQLSTCGLGSNDTFWSIALASRLVEFVMALLLLFTTVKTGERGLRLFICCKYIHSDQEALHGPEQGTITRNDEIRLCTRRGTNDTDVETESGVQTGHTSACLSPADSGVSLGSICIDMIPVTEGKLSKEALKSAKGKCCCSTVSTEKPEETRCTETEDASLTVEGKGQDGGLTSEEQDEANSCPKTMGICYTV